MIVLVDPLDTDPGPGPFYLAALEVGQPVVLLAGPLATHAEAVSLIDQAHSLPAVRPTHYTTAKWLPNSLGSMLGFPRGRRNRHFGLEG